MVRRFLRLRKCITASVRDPFRCFGGFSTWIIGRAPCGERVLLRSSAALRASLQRKEEFFSALLRHDYAALAPSGRAGPNAEVVP